MTTPLRAAWIAEPADVIGVLHFGLGPIGLAVARLASTRSNLRSVAAVDRDPALLGNQLSRLTETQINANDEGPVVEPRYRSSNGAKVVLHCTGSHLAAVLPELLECIADKLNVISTCE